MNLMYKRRMSLRTVLTRFLDRFYLKLVPETIRRESQERLRLAGILEATTDFVATFDLQGGVFYLNSAGREMLGMTDSADLSTLKTTDYHSTWAIEVLNERGLPIALRDGVWSGETSVVDHMGKEIPVSELIVAHKGASGEPAYLSSVMRDISDRKRREREMMAIVSITNALRVASTHAEMLPIILDKTIHALKMDGVIIAIADTTIPHLFIELGRGEWSDVANTHLMSRESLTHHVMNTLDVYLSNDVNADSRFTKPAALNRLRSVACAPLIAEKRAIGVMWIGRRAEGGEINSNELLLLDAITNIAANAIHRATLYEQTQLRAEQFAAVNALGRAMAETFDLQRIYSKLYESITRLLPYIGSVFISLYDANARIITCVYAMVDGQPLSASNLPPLPLDEPGAGTQSEAIHTRHPIIVNNLSSRLTYLKKYERVSHSETASRSDIYAPMIVQGKIIGLIQVQSYVADRFRQEDADLLSLVANTAAIAIENARLFAETAKRMEYLLALRNIDLAISTSIDPQYTLNVVLEQVCTQLQVDAAAVLLCNPRTQKLEYAAGKGFNHRHIEHSRLRWSDGTAERVAAEHCPIFISNMVNAPHSLIYDDVMIGEAFESYYAVPLIVKGKMEGVLEIFQRTTLNPDREWQEFLESLAAQAAVAIDNTLMFDRLQRSNAELTLAYDTTLEGWSRALDLRDQETVGHTIRVTELTLMFARRLGISDDDLVHIRRGAILHDIGKIGVPDNILLKPGPLTPEELAIMQRHPVYAYEFLATVPFLRLALDIPYCHHEYYDGNGYPRGLKGDEIPLAARVFSVVDHWDALVNDRPYRKAWDKARVRDYLLENSNKIFDPQMVQAFLRMLDEENLQ